MPTLAPLGSGWSVSIVLIHEHPGPAGGGFGSSVMHGEISSILRAYILQISERRPQLSTSSHL